VCVCARFFWPCPPAPAARVSRVNPPACALRTPARVLPLARAQWEVCAALSAAGRLIGADTIPAVLKLVKDLMQHKEAHVRKKVLIALHGFLQKSPESVEDFCVDIFKRSLCDKDPSVMSAGLNGLFDLAKKDPRAYASVVPSVVVILKQIIEHRLPRDYDYHRMPAPWLQIKLLKLLAVLGHANQRTSEEMYEVLRQTMQVSDLKTTIGYAIMFECIKTITRIYPQAELLAAAAENTARFMASDNRNLRYIGIDALSAIVSVNADYAKEHQMVVVECMEDPDETMRRKTLALLFGMTNAQNAEFVVARMTGQLEVTRDEFLKRDLVAKITSLAEKFAPSNSWYIQTMNLVFECGGDLVSVEVAHNFMRLIAEGPSGDEDQDNQLRVDACRSYLALLPKSNTADRLIQVCALPRPSLPFFRISRAPGDLRVSDCPPPPAPPATDATNLLSKRACALDQPRIAQGWPRARVRIDALTRQRIRMSRMSRVTCHAA